MDTTTTYRVLVSSADAARARQGLERAGVGYSETRWQPGIRCFDVEASDPAKLHLVFA